MSTEPLPPIVSAEAVQDRDDIIWCDVRWYLDRRPGRDAYDQAHIPTAIYVDLDEHLAFLPMKSEGRHPMPSAASSHVSKKSHGGSLRPGQPRKVASTSALLP